MKSGFMRGSFGLLLLVISKSNKSECMYLHHIIRDNYVASYTAYANPVTDYFATETKGLQECGVTK